MRAQAVPARSAFVREDSAESGSLRSGLSYGRDERGRTAPMKRLLKWIRKSRGGATRRGLFQSWGIGCCARGLRWSMEDPRRPRVWAESVRVDRHQAGDQLQRYPHHRQRLPDVARRQVRADASKHFGHIDELMSAARRPDRSRVGPGRVSCGGILCHASRVWRAGPPATAADEHQNGL